MTVQLRGGRWLAFGLGLALALFVAVALGTTALSPAQVWNALLGRGDSSAITVVRLLRLPRAVLAALVGAGLGISGAALQGVMRNPLAEPYLLGVSGGAAVGAVVAVALGVSLTLLPVAAFVGALLAVVVAFFVAHAAGTRGDARILLMAGVVVGAFANSVIMLVLGTSPANVVRDAVWWMMGSVAAATWTQDAWLLAYLVFGGGAVGHFLFFFLQAGSMALFGESVGGVRAVSTVIGSLAVVFTYLLARRLFGRTVAIAAAFP